MQYELFENQSNYIPTRRLEDLDIEETKKYLTTALEKAEETNRKIQEVRNRVNQPEFLNKFVGRRFDNTSLIDRAA